MAAPSSPALDPEPLAANAEDGQEAGSIEIIIGGRKAWVYQRVKGGVRAGCYYVKGNVPGGKALFRSTGFSTKGMAIDAAKKMWKAALEGRHDALDATKIRQDKPMATIGALVQAHALAGKRGELDIKGATADGYREALVRVIAWARGLHSRPEGAQRERIDAAAVAKVSAAVLEDPQTVADFVRLYLASAGEDILVRDERLRTAHSMMRNARALFADSVLPIYRGLNLPKLKPFLEAKLRKAEPVEHATLPDTAVHAMAKAALVLREKQPPLYLIHLLFRHLGMRNDEIEEARVEWIERLAEPRKIWLPDGQMREVVAVLAIRRRTYWKPKKSAGDVPISADVLAELQPFLDGCGGEEVLVPAATSGERHDLIYRAHSEFVQTWTGDRQKTSYELRRWGATKVARLHQSNEMADHFLRHAKKTVAEKHYLTERPMPAPLTLADCGL